MNKPSDNKPEIVPGKALSSYFDLPHGGDAQYPVQCPFHNDDKPSAGVYLHKPITFGQGGEYGVFHCNACPEGDNGFSDTEFLQKLWFGEVGSNFTSSYNQAKRIRDRFNLATTVSLEEWKKMYTFREADRNYCKNILHFTDKVIDKFNLRSDPKIIRNEGGLHFMIPVVVFGQVLATRTYCPGNQTKMIGEGPNQLILNYDEFVEELKNNPDKLITIVAGEKDFLAARSAGIFCISITGGEKALPVCPELFRNKNVYIVYDNDTSGREGMTRLAQYLTGYGAKVTLGTTFHKICKENKEDIWDFFNKYNMTREDFKLCKASDKVYEYIPEKDAKEMLSRGTLTEAEQDKAKASKTFKSEINVISVDTDSAYVIPNSISLLVDNQDQHDWTLQPRTYKDILLLGGKGIDKYKRDTIIMKDIFQGKVPKGVPYSLDIDEENTHNIYKALVSEPKKFNEKAQATVFTAYCIDMRLESSKDYVVDYVIVPHPLNEMKDTLIIYKASPPKDTIGAVKKEDVVEAFAQFKTAQEEDLNEYIRHELGFDGNSMMITLQDLTYNSCLEFKFKDKVYKGTLDTLMITESRQGKSKTAEALSRLYGKGEVINMSGAGATLVSLVGGTIQSNGGNYTKAGHIPQNNKGIVIFEEISKAPPDVITNLTDIRSSGIANITRLQSKVEAEAKVRMLTFANTKGEGQPIKSYPNGVSIIKDLIGTPEDIARYDIMAIFPEMNIVQDPNRVFKPHPDDKYYKTKITWAWTRTADQIIWDADMENYILERSNDLNRDYKSHIKLFGPEAWKKIARIAIAYAIREQSTEDYETVLVKQMYIDKAIDLLVSLYDNEVFNFKKYCEDENKYNYIDEDGVAKLQSIYKRYPTVITYLEEESTPSRTQLISAAGGKTEDTANAIKELHLGNFIKQNKYDILPTARFREGCKLIDHNIVIKGVGES